MFLKGKFKITVLLIIGALLIVLLAMSSVAEAKSAKKVKVCPGTDYLFCDDFSGRTFFKDERSSADWNRFPADVDDSANYHNINREGVLRLEVDTDSTDEFYTNANISTSEINNKDGEFLFGEDTRVDVRMRYSDNTNANFLNPGTARGSAGLLFWNYFTIDVDPENGLLGPVRDSFGFIWQDSVATTPGFWLTAISQGVPGEFTPMPTVDINEFHVYSLERRHDSMRYFIDDVLVKEVPLNQPGTLQLPAESKLSVDMWFDDASYDYNPATLDLNLFFNEIEEEQFIDIDFVRVTELN